jgi:PAS domain-containing protein
MLLELASPRQAREALTGPEGLAMTKPQPPPRAVKATRRAVQDGDLRLEQAILQAKPEWERTFDSVPDCILILDDQLCARRLNMSLGERLGAHPRDILGQTLEELTGLEGQAAARLRRMCSEAACSAEEMEIPDRKSVV